MTQENLSNLIKITIFDSFEENMKKVEIWQSHSFKFNLETLWNSQFLQVVKMGSAHLVYIVATSITHNHSTRISSWGVLEVRGTEIGIDP